MTKFLKNADVTGYISQTSVTSSLLKTDSAGKLVAAVAGTDYATPGALASSDKMVTIGRNATGATLYQGTVVYISGSTGNRPNFVKAQANGEATSAGTFGVVLADIPNNSDGNVVTIGAIDNLDTRSDATNPFTSDTLVDGDTIYLSPTTAGYITRVKPSAPNHIVYVGKVVRTSPTNGTIVYRIQNGYELDEIHDVAITSKANNEVLVYESATTLWKNKSISTILGYTPEQPLTFSSPLTRTTNTVSIPAASGSVNGYLSSTDWTTFNGKQPLLTNPVTGTGTTSYLPKFTGTSALGNSLIYDTGSVILIGATTASDAQSKLELISSNTVGLKIKSSGANGNNTFLSIESSKEWRFLTNRGDLVPGNQGDLIIRNNTDAINQIILNQDGSTKFYSSVTAGSFVKSGGVAAEILAADGSVITAGTGIAISGGTIAATGGASSSARTEQTFTATTGSNTFTVTGGYTVGLIDVYVNGVKYPPSDYTASTGTTVVIGGLVSGDIVSTIAYTSTISLLPTSRDVIEYTATSGQVDFTVSGGYVIGLLDVYVNGTKLTSSEYSMPDTTKFTLAIASVAGNQVQAIRYNASTTGISGSGTTNYVPKFTATGTIGNSAITDNGTTVTLVSRALSGTTSTMTTGFAAGSASATYPFNSTSTSGTQALFNSTRTNGGGILIQSSGVGILDIGTTNYCGFSGATGNDAGITTEGAYALAFGTNTTERMRISSTGYTGIGITAPKTILQINGGTGAYPTLGTNVTNSFLVGRNDGLLGTYFGYASDGNGWIQQMRNDTATAYDLVLQPVGGAVLVGTTVRVASSLLGVTGSSTAFNLLTIKDTNTAFGDTWYVYCLNNSNVRAGGIEHTGSTTVSFVTTSDYRLKENEQPIQNALNKVLALNPITYTWKEDQSLGEGFLAHELQEQIPFAVTGQKDALDKDGNINPQGVDYSKVVPVLVKAIQELKAELDLLKNK